MRRTGWRCSSAIAGMALMTSPLPSCRAQPHTLLSVAYAHGHSQMTSSRARLAAPLVLLCVISSPLVRAQHPSPDSSLTRTALPSAALPAAIESQLRAVVVYLDSTTGARAPAARGTATAGVRFWDALGSEQGKLLFGFLLTTLVGGILTVLFQQYSWKRQVRLDLYRQRYRDGTDLLARVSSLIDRRYFALQRLMWSIDERASPTNIIDKEREYFAVVVEWNGNLRALHNSIRLLIGENEALAFLDYEDDKRPNAPRSLHYRFVLAHRSVMQARSDPTLAHSARHEVDLLNWTLSSFLYDVTTVFATRAGTLELLVAPEAPSATSKARQTSGPGGDVGAAQALGEIERVPH